MNARHQIQRSRNIVILILVSVVFFWPFNVTGEEWTAEQKEVWEVVKAGWEKIKNSDSEGLAENVHKNAIIWWSSTTSPHRVEMIRGSYDRWFNYEKVIESELQPLRIEIFNDIALIAYYANWKSDRRSAKVKYLLVYMKQGDKWLSIGSLASMCGKPPACME
jgi:hypothetical protein